METGMGNMDEIMTDPLAPGSNIAHYRIISRLGEGGMGAVYLADDTRLGRRVALKVLPASLAADPERMQRFVQEARLASALTHPNVAYIYEIGGDQAGEQHIAEQPGLRFIAMEYVEGEPLSARLTRGPLALSELLSIGAQIADALDDAHSKGIVHRDIKPSNLMLTPRGYVKVLDFGLAKLEAAKTRDETQLITNAGTVLGTVAYMSPEQALGRDLDHRTDLFSLGVVLYEMATARLPFSGATVSETIARILNSQPEALARFNYGIPEGLDRVVRKCLEKDRERRYQTARELVVDLKNLERDSGGVVPLATPERNTISAIFVDDEELARALLREYAASSTGIEILAECANGFEAVKAISEKKPDLVFLDVQMPKLDGFEVLELIGQEVAVIFVTAFDQYAMRAFDEHAVDYLLKPFSLERFQKALERARQRLGENKSTPKALPATELARAARPPREHLQRIVVKDGARVHIIPVERLDYAEAQDDYVSLHSQGKSYLKEQTISSLEAALDPERFVRIHRSTIVNLERVEKIEPYAKDSRVAILSDGAQLPVSRAGYERLRALLEK
jgi:two-component system LytT family response regulator